MARFLWIQSAIFFSFNLKVTINGKSYVGKAFISFGDIKQKYPNDMLIGEIDTKY